MSDIAVSGTMVAVLGSLISLLLVIIGFFLHRLVIQFDKLNETVQRVDKNLSEDVVLLKAENTSLKQQVRDLEPLWDRMRAAEMKLAVVDGRCPVHCKQTKGD